MSVILSIFHYFLVKTMNLKYDSRIEDEFNGWDENAIFKLPMGQSIIQQILRE